MFEYPLYAFHKNGLEWIYRLDGVRIQNWFPQ